MHCRRLSPIAETPSTHDRHRRSKLPVNIEDEMKRSYLDYAMSVIIGRALPDVRDGLKPVHRRVLYGMRTMGLASQPRLPQVREDRRRGDGQLPPARRRRRSTTRWSAWRRTSTCATRWSTARATSARSTATRRRPCGTPRRGSKALAEEMMADLDKETVDFVPNYDETTEEPTVLPAPFPNLLVNGSAGIAVGMATNIPPHNLREVIDGVIWLIEHQSDETPTMAEDQGALLEVDPGPGLPDRRLHRRPRRASSRPTRTGRGVDHDARQGRRSRRSKKGDRTSIVVTEIPYQVNKARLIEKIAELVREKTIEGISDMRDESDRDGMRIVIELKRGEVAEVVLNNLYKHTQLQTTLRRHHAGDRRRPAAGAVAGRAPRALRRVPARGRAAPDRVRAAQGRGARPHPRRAEDRARPPRRGDRADPRVEEPGRGARRPDDAVRPERRSRRRRSSTCSCSA